MNFTKILIMYFLYSIVINGSRPILPLFAESEGVSVIIIGFLVSTFSLFPMFLAIYLGKLLDKFGIKRMLSIGGSGILIGLIAPVPFPSLATLFLSQFFLGLSFTIILISLQKGVGNLQGNRDKLIATWSLVGSFGELIGPLVSGFSYEHIGFLFTYTIYTLVICFAVIVGFTLKSMIISTDKDSGERGNKTWDLLKNPNLRKAILVSALVLYSKDIFISFFPLYASSIGINASTIGIILAVMASMAMGIRLIQFHLVSYFGRTRVLASTIIVSGVAFILISFSQGVNLLALLSGILGAGLGLGQPLSLVYALNSSLPENHGQVLGIRLAFNRGSQFLAPVIFGGLGGFVGLAPLFWVSGGILLLGAYFTQGSLHEKNRGLKGE